MKKIIFCIGNLSQGGAERQIIYAASLLHNSGYEVELLILKSGSAYEHNLPQGVKVNYLYSPSFLSSCYKLVSFLKRNKACVVISFLPYAILVSRFCSKFIGSKLISVYRNEKSTSKLKDNFLRLSCFLDSLTASNVAAAKKNMYCSAVGNGFQLIDNVYMGEHFDHSTVISNRRDIHVWGYVGRLESQKNLESLLASFKRHKEQYPDSYLHIVGEGQVRNKLERICVENQLEEWVHFLGYQDNVAAVYSEFDSFILPSLREGTPNALMEAMAAGLPVVATPVGAMPEMIKDGVSGILCEDTSVESLTESMNRLRRLSKPEKNKMGEVAKEYIYTRHSPERVTKQWVDLIEKVTS